MVLSLHWPGRTQTVSAIGQAGRYSAQDCNRTPIKCTGNLNTVNLKSGLITLNSFARFVILEYFDV